MCTAISTNKFFGRNFDWDTSFGESIVITPQNYSFKFRHAPSFSRHYAIIGTALLNENYPLYFDGVNEKGLAAAGLYFPNFARYRHYCEGFENVASFEFIPYLLSQCSSVFEAEKLLSRINITDEAFSQDLPPTPLHWIIADKERAITVEQTQKGITIYQNDAGVLTNSPTFDIQLFNLSNYINLTVAEPVNRFSEKLNLKPCCGGMGAFMLPGDFSSHSRFVRAAFIKENFARFKTDKENISQFFHLLGAVMQIKGCTGDHYSIYSSCMDLSNSIYYYKTYFDESIRFVNLHSADISGSDILSFSF